MKNLKNILAVMLLLVGSAAFAQQDAKPQSRKEMAEQRFRQFSDKVKLDADQQTKVRAIMKEQRESMKQARAMEGQQRREAAKNTMMQTDEKIKAVLRDDQKPLYDQYKAERKAEMKKRMEERKKSGSGMNEDMLDDGIL